MRERDAQDGPADLLERAVLHQHCNLGRYGRQPGLSGRRAPCRAHNLRASSDNAIADAVRCTAAGVLYNKGTRKHSGRTQRVSDSVRSGGGDGCSRENFLERHVLYQMAIVDVFILKLYPEFSHLRDREDVRRPLHNERRGFGKGLVRAGPHFEQGTILLRPDEWLGRRRTSGGLLVDGGLKELIRSVAVDKEGPYFL